MPWSTSPMGQVYHGQPRPWARSTSTVPKSTTQPYFVLKYCVSEFQAFLSAFTILPFFHKGSVKTSFSFDHSLYQPIFSALPYGHFRLAECDCMDSSLLCSLRPPIRYSVVDFDNIPSWQVPAAGAMILLLHWLTLKLNGHRASLCDCSPIMCAYEYMDKQHNLLSYTYLPCI